MSGTSMDGIDATLVTTDGKTLVRTGYEIKVSYKKKTIKELISIIFKINNFDNYFELEKLSNLITNDHKIAVDKLISLSGLKPDLIGFHGQTILHNPSNKTSIQIGNGKLLSSLTNTKVISNFRENDLFNGGQGAPIAPIYHKYIIENLKLELPCCFINIGGVSNLTYWDGHQLIGFDLGPGNGLMDIYCQKKLGIMFDKFGEIASKGIPSKKIIKQFRDLPYFKKKYPKSLDRLSFEGFLQKTEMLNLNHSDTLATLLEFSLYSIIMGINILPSKPKKIILMGGGQHNYTLYNRIKVNFDCEVLKSNEIFIPGDFIEAELIAYLSARRLNLLPATYPSTTGVKFPCIGGVIN